MKTIAFRQKWQLTDDNFSNVNGLCSRDFDEETGKPHVKSHSEKWGGSFFYVLLLLLFYFSEFSHLVTFI